MIHGQMVQEGGSLSWQVWQSVLPCGISGQLHVSLMDLIAGLPELQALILLVHESFVFPVGLSALALRRQ